MSRRLRLALLLASLAVALTTAPLAAANGRVLLAEAGGAQFPDRAFILTLPSDRPLTASQLRVSENGQPVSGVTLTPPASAAGNQFGVVLVIDTSDSMKGQPIDGALQAAQLFVSHREPTQQVAVVTFNSRPQVALPFTTDATKIVQTLAHTPTLAYGTRIYDAVRSSLGLLSQAHINAGSIVVLSDGADTGSSISRADVLAAARAAHVRIFTVGLHSAHFDPRALQDLATGGAAGYSEAQSIADLTNIYDQLGTQLSHQYVLRYRSYQALGAKVRVSVKVAGFSGTAHSGYATPPLPPPVFKTFQKGVGTGFWTSPFTMIVFSVFAVALVAFCVVVLVMPRRRTLQRRLAEFVSLAQASDGKSIGAALPDRVPETNGKSIEGSLWWDRFLEELELGEIKIKPAHIVVWTLVGTVLFMWIVAVLFSYAAILFGFFIPFGVWSLIHRKAERRRNLFAEQLPDNLAVLASAVRAGHSFVGALSVVVDDAPEPARTEFRRVVADEQLGRPLEDALEVVVQRMKNQDLAQVALVAALQREAGGSTAEVLDRVVETVRDRQDLRRLVRTLTAAGRMSRWVVSFLPVVLLLAIAILSPHYLHPLFAETSGRVLFVFAALLVIGGSLVIKRIVDIKV